MSHISFDSDGNLHKRQARSVKYRITPFTGKDPKSSDRQLLVNPIDTFSSPNGWHGQSAVTIGNNVIATENSANVKGTRAILNNGQNARGTDDFTFDFAIDDKNQVPLDYTFASITNVFVLTNRFHDLFYRYGFTESAGNFQQNNFGKGGRDRDPVLAVVHDGSGRNNANFATPPDGQSGVMKMFVFDRTKPMRDGALENGIVNHELAHGLSARLTGGKAQGNCLNSPESGALGEGWSDAIAMAIEMSSNSKRTDNVAFGKYVTGNEIKGIRTLPYSTNIKTNPLKFSRGQQTEQVHTLGEVWASMLFDMYWNLVDKHGFDPQFATNPKGNGGNNKFLQLLVTGMKTQPCFPTFVTARNAILSADRLLFKSENLCEIWTAFARRGLGMRAVDDGSFIDDFTFPEGCEIPEPSNSGPGAMNSSAYQSYALSIVWFLFGAHALFYL
ncbi:peptidase M36 [Globomyces pollinis-pini]|nr:peptidase M36 [Globomyces pollinis-pini]